MHHNTSEQSHHNLSLLFPDSYFTVMKFHYRMLKSKFLSLSPKNMQGVGALQLCKTQEAS